jgi:hypothetical protein
MMSECASPILLSSLSGPPLRLRFSAITPDSPLGDEPAGLLWRDRSGLVQIQRKGQPWSLEVDVALPVTCQTEVPALSAFG